MKLPPRTKKVPVRRWTDKKVEVPVEEVAKGGSLMAILKMLIDVTTPILLAWATKRHGQVLTTSRK